MHGDDSFAAAGDTVQLLRRVFRPVVTDQVSLRLYAFSVTLFAWIVALSVDIVNQLVFFTNWTDCWREWSITTIVVVAIAFPVARAMGRAHLALHLVRAEAERLSRTDPMTGLGNRRAFYEAAQALSGGALALVLADIDRFKRINDRYGHAAGDAVIKAVAARLQAELGDLGAVVRLGGEEFALIAPHHCADEVRARLPQIRKLIALEPVPFAGKSLSATISIGFAAHGETDFDALYAAADTALYVAKSGGRDRVVDYDEIGEIAAAVKDAILRAS
jgi:diguanylate cyclase (GGDEF)-like protein